MQVIHMKKSEWNALQVAKCESDQWKRSYQWAFDRIVTLNSERDAIKKQRNDMQTERDGVKEELEAMTKRWDRACDRSDEIQKELTELKGYMIPKVFIESPDPVPGYRSALTRARNVQDLVIGSIVGTVAGAGLIFLFMRHFS